MGLSANSNATMLPPCRHYVSNVLVSKNDAWTKYHYSQS